LITAAAGEDRREHLLRLSPAGQRKLQQSRPLWEEAQRRFASQLGQDALRELQRLLAVAESAAAKASEALSKDRN
jgi:DNA-binding MarR family transcriptional regulator